MLVSIFKTDLAIETLAKKDLSKCQLFYHYDCNTYFLGNYYFISREVLLSLDFYYNQKVVTLHDTLRKEVI